MLEIVYLSANTVQPIAARCQAFRPLNRNCLYVDLDLDIFGCSKSRQAILRYGRTQRPLGALLLCLSEEIGQKTFVRHFHTVYVDYSCVSWLMKNTEHSLSCAYTVWKLRAILTRCTSTGNIFGSACQFATYSIPKKRERWVCPPINIRNKNWGLGTANKNEGTNIFFRAKLFEPNLLLALDLKFGSSSCDDLSD